MTTAELVNLILDKLRTSKVTFDYIADDPEYVCVGFEYGGNYYRASKMTNSKTVVVQRHTVRGFEMLKDNYSAWVEGVLNGGTRDDAGVVS